MHKTVGFPEGFETKSEVFPCFKGKIHTHQVLTQLCKTIPKWAQNVTG